MGGTFDGVSGIESLVSTAFGLGKLGVIESAHARCWVLRDRMRFHLRMGSRRTSGLFLLPAGAGAGRVPPVL